MTLQKQAKARITKLEAELAELRQSAAAATAASAAPAPAPAADLELQLAEVTNQLQETQQAYEALAKQHRETEQRVTALAAEAASLREAAAAAQQQLADQQARGAAELERLREEHARTADAWARREQELLHAAEAATAQPAATAAAPAAAAAAPAAGDDGGWEAWNDEEPIAAPVAKPVASSASPTSADVKPPKSPADRFRQQWDDLLNELEQLPQPLDERVRDMAATRVQGLDATAERCGCRRRLLSRARTRCLRDLGGAQSCWRRCRSSTCRCPSRCAWRSQRARRRRAPPGATPTQRPRSPSSRRPWRTLCMPAVWRGIGKRAPSAYTLGKLSRSWRLARGACTGPRRCGAGAGRAAVSAGDDGPPRAADDGGGVQGGAGAGGRRGCRGQGAAGRCPGAGNSGTCVRRRPLHLFVLDR